MCSKKSLSNFIEHKRKVMMEAANNYGMNADITIRHSQELDELLNQYRKIMLQNSKRHISDYNFGI